MRPDLRRWTRPQLEHAVRAADRQRAAVLELHQPLTAGAATCCAACWVLVDPDPDGEVAPAAYPCPTVRALGVDAPPVPSGTGTTSPEETAP